MTLPDSPFTVRSAFATLLGARGLVGVRESEQAAWMNANPNTAMSGVRRMQLLLARGVFRERRHAGDLLASRKPRTSEKVRADDAAVTARSLASRRVAN